MFYTTHALKKFAFEQTNKKLKTRPGKKNENGILHTHRTHKVTIKQKANKCEERE